MYNMLERKIEPEVMPWCDENRVGILAYSPMHSGLLTGKVSREWFLSLPQNGGGSTKMTTRLSVIYKLMMGFPTSFSSGRA